MEQNKTENAIPFVRELRKKVPILPILGLVIALALSAGLVTSFDYDIGHFAYGSVMFYVTAAAIIAAAGFSAVYGKLAREKFSLASCPQSEPLTTCASYFTALMAAITSAAAFYDAYLLFTHIPSTLEFFGIILLPALTVSTILGAHENFRSSVVRVIFALVAVLAVNFHMFACYFDFTLPLNSAVRNIITIAQGGVLLFLLSEVRLALSPEKRAASPFFIFANAFAASGVLGISFGLAVYAFVSPHAAEMGVSVYRFACYFGIGLTALSRLLGLSASAGTYVAPPNPEESGETTKKQTKKAAR